MSRDASISSVPGSTPARAPEFVLPKDWQVFCSNVMERCEDLIHYGIWGGLHPARLLTWFANFHTDEEKYFAACLLDSLIYRSDQQTLALAEQLFQRVLPDLFRRDPPPVLAPQDWFEALKRFSGAGDPGIRLVPVVKRTDPPIKSAFMIARLMKRHLSVDERWIIAPSDIPRHAGVGATTFVFVDDFLGTGDQFKEFVTAEGLASGFGSMY